MRAMNSLRDRKFIRTTHKRCFCIPTCFAEGEDLGRPSEEDGEEDENNVFEEENEFEGARVSLILEDVIRHIDYLHAPGNRYTEMTRLWAFGLLRTCGSKALGMVRGQFSVPPCQVLSQRPPSNYVQSDLIDFFIGGWAGSDMVQ
jgi:hypothetical protein